MTEPADGPPFYPRPRGQRRPGLPYLVRPQAVRGRPASESGPGKTPRGNLCRPGHASPRPNGSRPPRASPPGPVPTSGAGRPPSCSLRQPEGTQPLPCKSAGIQPPERPLSAPARQDRNDPASPTDLPELCLGHCGRIPSPADVARAPDGKGQNKRDRQMAPDNRREH